MSSLRQRLAQSACLGRWKDYVHLLGEHAELQSADISINSKCNLNCAHCSDVLSSGDRPEIQLEQWIRVVKELAEIGVQHLHICGKEPFLSPWLPELLSVADHLKRKTGWRYGLVTNGTLLGANLRWLCSLSIDYIDVSVDGLRKGHDALRGDGCFDKIIEQIGVAVDRLGEGRITLATTVCSHNVAEIPDMIDFFCKMGVRYFFLQPVQMDGKALQRPDLRLSAAAFLKLSEELVTRKGDGKALIEVYTDYPYKKNMFSSCELFRRTCESVSLGQPLVFEIPMGELQFTFNWLCYAYWRSCMITPFGDYLGCCTQAAQAKRAGAPVGHITESSIAQLFSKSQKENCLMSFHRPNSGGTKKLEVSGAGINRCPVFH